MNKKELDRLFSITYEELKRLASGVKNGSAGATYNPTALVNEAYVKLIQSSTIKVQSKKHFMRLAAKAMRQILIDAARRHQSLKRGGNQIFVTYNEGVNRRETRIEELLSLDSALNRLERLHPRQAKLVEYRFFGGYNLAETVELLEVSESTVLRDWKMAKAWLSVHLNNFND